MSLPGGPCGRREIGDELDGHVCQSGQYFIQVVADRDAKAAAVLNHGEDRGHARSGLLAADMDPVFSAQRDSPDILPMSVRN